MRKEWLSRPEPSKGRSMRSADTSKTRTDRLHSIAWKPKKRSKRANGPRQSRRLVTAARLQRKGPDRSRRRRSGSERKSRERWKKRRSARSSNWQSRKPSGRQK